MSDRTAGPSPDLPLPSTPAGRDGRSSFVRPYVLTRGRTAPAIGALQLHSPVLALVTPDQMGRTATPEDRRIVELSQTPVSVAELSARLRTPVGVLKVLLGDLIESEVVAVRSEPTAGHRDVRLLERLLEGIRAL
jgi:hypothetical protein